MKVKFLKDTKACLGGTNYFDFEKDDVAEVSDKLGKLLVAGEQAEKSTAKITVDPNAEKKETDE